MKKTLLILHVLCLFSYAQTTQIAPKYIDSIFTEKGGINIFFYKENENKSNFLQEQNLMKALISRNVKIDIANQLGVFFADDSYEIHTIIDNSAASKLGLKAGDNLINFGGIELSNSYIGPFHEDFYNQKSPSFMLTIKRQGNTIEFGGSIKDLPIKEWSDNFLKRYSLQVDPKE
ncbi:MAG: hypothetical protein LBD84_02795 [Campylobacteraceae bacterium]|jgi:C-terminal processing protease CtpA/Prc|nr:hypothetical protein [Campylobacteraceae bacterium]